MVLKLVGPFRQMLPCRDLFPFDCVLLPRDAFSLEADVLEQQKWIITLLITKLRDSPINLFKLFHYFP